MPDSASATAVDASAPAAERFDAQVDLHRSGLQNALVPADEVRPVIDYIMDRMQTEREMMKSTVGGRNDQNVIQGPWSKRKNAPGPQSVILDDFTLFAQGQYWDRPGILGFDSMRSMVDQTPILNAIIITRIRQMKRFCRPMTARTRAGFMIEHIDDNVELGDEQQQSIKLLERFFANCGWEDDPRRRKRLKRDNLAQFMAKSIRDTLTMDAAPIETIFKRDRALGLDGFLAVDGATIRLCTEEGYEGDDEIFALQVIDGRVRTAYDYDQLVYEVRNPQSTVTACGYGYSETEMLIKVVTYLLNTMTYNASFFDKNSIPRGILTVMGNYDAADLSAFKRYWNTMVRGAQNAHNMPVLVSKDQESAAQFTEIGGQMEEMAFGKWMSFLTSIACAIYGVAPEEVSMESFATSKSALSGDDTDEKMVSANDKGFRPLVSHYEDVFSDFLIRPISPNYCFRFGGLDEEDAKQKFEARKLGQTWNEFRKGEGEDPIKGPLGDMPMNQSFIPTWSAATGIGQPEPEEEDFGDPAAQGGSGAGAQATQDDQTEDPHGGAEAITEDADPSGAGDAGFGAPPAEMGKSFTAADFGLLPVFAIED